MKNELYEVVEVCPHCDAENVQQWNVDTMGFVTRCNECGKLIMLCDECMHRDDNADMHCDWCDGKCFRGITKF